MSSKERPGPLASYTVLPGGRIKLTHGFCVVETDLGEYILQINDSEPPSHIIAPVVHKDKEEIADLFAKTHNKPRLTDIPEMTREAREVLRPEFLSADMGVTGGNFIIAETGSVAVVTNEGNGDLTQTLPRVHVAVTSIEKVVPTLEDAGYKGVVLEAWYAAFAPAGTPASAPSTPCCSAWESATTSL